MSTLLRCIIILLSYADCRTVAIACHVSFAEITYYYCPAEATATLFLEFFLSFFPVNILIYKLLHLAWRNVVWTYGISRSQMKSQGHVVFLCAEAIGVTMLGWVFAEEIFRYFVACFTGLIYFMWSALLLRNFPSASNHWRKIA